MTAPVQSVTYTAPMVSLFHMLLPQADQVLHEPAAACVFAAADAVMKRLGSETAMRALVSLLCCSYDSKLPPLRAVSVSVRVDMSEKREALEGLSHFSWRQTT